VLGERVERNLDGVRETLIVAAYTKNCRRLLEDAKLAPELVRFQMRLARDLECLKVQSYAFAARSIDSMRILFGRNSRAVFLLGASSQVKVAVPRRVTSVARTNEAQARRVW
jgi:hypothetical protein